MGKREEAIKDYTKAIDVDPDYAEAYNNRGNAYNSMGKQEEAIKDYTKAIELGQEYKSKLEPIIKVIKNSTDEVAIGKA